MKSVLRYTAAGVALATLGFASNASAATASANAQAEILESLTVTLDAGDATLDFGTIALNNPATGGTVALTAANVRTCAAALTCVGTTATPNFDIQGAANRAVSISFLSPTISLTGAGTPMSVTLSSSSAGFTLSGAGTGDFDVGGTLTVGANQAAGVYTGTLNVVVIYS